MNKENMCQCVIGIAEKSLNIVIIYDNIFISSDRAETLIQKGLRRV